MVSNHYVLQFIMSKVAIKKMLNVGGSSAYTEIVTTA